MSIILLIDGIEVTVSSASEAAELVRELRRGPAGHRTSEVQATPRQTPPPAAPQPSIVLEASVVSDALKFLRAIQAAGSDGAQAETIRVALGVEKPKAVGSRSAAINSALRSLGMKPEAVYKNPRTKVGRVWSPGKQMQNAISVLEQRLSAH